MDPVTPTSPKLPSSSPPFFQGLTRADRITLAILGCVALLALPYVMFGTAWITSFGSLKVEEKASVFQAVSSVIAIVAGAAAIYWQVGRQRAAARDSETAEQLRRLALLSGSIFWCRVSCATLQDASASGLPVASEVAELKLQCEALRAIPVLEMPDWRSGYAVAQAVQAFVAHECKLRPEDDSLSERLRDDRVKWSTVIAQRFDFAEEQIERAMEVLGGALPGISYTTTSIMGGHSIYVAQGAR